MVKRVIQRPGQGRVRLRDGHVPGETCKQLHIYQPVLGPAWIYCYSLPVWQVGKWAQREVRRRITNN